MISKLLKLNYYSNIRNAFQTFKKKLKIKYLGGILLKVNNLIQNKMKKGQYFNDWYSYLKTNLGNHKEVQPSNSPDNMEVTFKKSDPNILNNQAKIIKCDIYDKNMISFSSLNLEEEEKNASDTLNKHSPEISKIIEKSFRSDKEIINTNKEDLVKKECKSIKNLNSIIIEHPLQNIQTTFSQGNMHSSKNKEHLDNREEIKFINSIINENDNEKKIDNSVQEIEKEISDIHIPNEYLNSSWKGDELSKEVDNISHLKSNSCNLHKVNEEQDSKNSISQLKNNLDLHYFRNEINVKDPEPLNPDDSKNEQLEESPHFDLGDPQVRNPQIDYPQKLDSFDKKDLFGDDYNSKSISSSQKYGSSNQEISVISSSKKGNYSIEKKNNQRELLIQILREWKKIIKERMLLKQYLKESKIEEKYSVTPLGSSRFDMPKMHFVTPNSCSDVLSPLDIPTPNSMLNFKSPEETKI